MKLGRLINLVVISGIFGKRDDKLDILPPPPPFPELGEENVETKEAKRTREKQERQKQREIKLKRKKGVWERRYKEKESRKSKLKKSKEKKKQVKEKTLQRPKKAVFGKIFGEKTDFAKELKEIEEISLEPLKDKKSGAKAKLEMPGLISLKGNKFDDDVYGPKDIVKAEGEIQKAISSMKGAKRPSIVRGLFKKKKPAEEKVETPEVMPRTYDKIDYVELIEEKLHKARLALMDFKFDDTKNVYLEIMKMYNELEPKKKSKVYQDIKDLYYERKSAEKFVK